MRDIDLKKNNKYGPVICGCLLAASLAGGIATLMLLLSDGENTSDSDDCPVRTVTATGSLGVVGNWANYMTCNDTFVTCVDELRTLANKSTIHCSNFSGPLLPGPISITKLSGVPWDSFSIILDSILSLTLVGGCVSSTSYPDAPDIVCKNTTDDLWLCIPIKGVSGCYVNYDTQISSLYNGSKDVDIVNKHLKISSSEDSDSYARDTIVWDTYTTTHCTGSWGVVLWESGDICAAQLNESLGL